jgi:predicted methyltransferase
MDQPNAASLRAMKHSRCLLICALLFAASCGGKANEFTPVENPQPEATPAEAEAPADDGAALRAAVDNDARPAEDRARDEDRKPFEVLSFFGIKPGMHVADMAAGGGYYTEILAQAVGPEGRVYVQNNKFILERFAEKPLSERLARMNMDNVQRLNTEFDDPGLPAGELDAVLMFLFYHDTYWMGTDRARMNKAIFDSLKPGGVFAVVDHHAVVGTRDKHVKDIHRIEPELIKQEVLAAGFVLDAESDLLRHPEDDRTRNVFDPELRGKTDQFMFRFRKPE